ncbi:pyruvate dehydrogenase (acetyl-transferring) E1 component subunit alpha [Stenotrophomonas maltophilia]|uniref:pyruvate dehydrogenase (acetyl-transferring) E1 component subunit alpha n=1 Tax=Stenotrophomonas maltophilia TaxID=40324 RepID=UPI001310BA88|nr:pyruvate dehydrogenase (acetyl-transferring) E1 component subunit alpha [Stenotrophomonas maltophilia]MBA0284953.1 pyruvate dehydrogenase (acetyl-transferring) E1 component subunit alpha [Stenotrophomonas maltophilia]MBA0323632.1 pyruvate dehydrogenase (acetyl-transferring) E1 component subunit alpha [Stenotrophomonas maltophilia]
MTVAAEFKIEYLQYLDTDGTLVRDDLPMSLRDPKVLVPLFKQMLFVRTFDSKSIALQRTGKLGTYAACLGHEAAHVGIGAAMQKDDVFAPSYREYGAMFMRGVRPHDVLMYWGGDERGNDYGGNAAKDFPFCVPISTQCLHAAGAALKFKLNKEPQIAVAVCGDGGSSKTDFYAALNSAGAYKLPLILCIVNNGWAISVPRSAQTGAETLAQKGLAGGLHCLQVDGNDLIAVLAAMEQARERALAGNGGTVLELMTYRLSDHTTADDARRYRDDAEVKDAWQREPMLRLRKYLINAGVWSEDEETAWVAECGARVDEEVNLYLNTPVQPVEAMFDFLYADPPQDLLAQRAQAIALEKRHG